MNKRRSFIVGIKSTKLSVKEKSFLKKYKPWGVILFTRNIKNIDQTLKLTTSIRKLFKDKKYEDARFMFERGIVFNPKDSNSYLYLAKIYNIQEDQDKEEKNLEATLLIEPNNEEAILMSMKIALERSNYLKVKDLSNTFSKVCKKLCNENKEILDTLANIEPKKNES